MQFTKLRLTGFKSFVDSADLMIEPGLTGVVGPNGCGKSNVLEALRWVMGETSARQMRGAEMSDVIFGGTAARPPRNVAEVMVQMDNSARTAPALFNEFDQLDITRRIERGGGSAYKVNGKEVRVKDVQLLFADAATGARSNAMVSQGKIGALINAKPVQRRLILEEAAGITGLHTRRHEAELKLSGAETNLERLDDVIATVESQIASLKRQAAQARRYREVTDSIRRTEATSLLIRWHETTARRDNARALLVEGEGKVRELTSLSADASRRQASLAARLPALRQAEAEAAAALQRLVIEREGMEKDREALTQRIAALKSQIQQIAVDISRESELANDAQGALAKLMGERDELLAGTDGQDDRLQIVREKAEQADAKVTDCEAECDHATRELADMEARSRSAEARFADLTARRDRLIERHDDAVMRLDDIRVQADFSERIEQADLALEEARETLVLREEALEAAAGAIEAAVAQEQALKTAETETESRYRMAEAACAKVVAEIDALNAVLGTRESDFPPILDRIIVAPGAEKAVAAVFGDELNASLIGEAPFLWSGHTTLELPEPLPDGAEPLSSRVEAPRELALALSQIGVVGEEEALARLADELRPGQALVTPQGRVWRWDGYQVSADAPQAAAVRFEQRNRLAELQKQRAVAEQDAETAETAQATARAALGGAHQEVEQARAAERDADQAMRAAAGAVSRTQEERAHLAREAGALQTRITTAQEAVTRAKQDLEELDETLLELAEERESLSDCDAARDALAIRRAALAEARADQMETRTLRERMERDMTGRQRRLEFVRHDIASWQERAGGAGDRVTALKERREETTHLLKEVESGPEALEERKALLSDKIDYAETRRKQAADALGCAETDLKEVETGLKAAEAALSQAREGRVRAESQLEAADSQLRDLADRVREKLNCAASDLPEQAGITGSDLPDIHHVERELGRLIAARDGLGAVNLRAEVELTGMEAERETYLNERADLTGAIAKLRAAIAELNKEARQRLLGAFKLVDGHFRRLFGQLFGGGRAQLAMTDADDPLDAGLEILASPPGKKLQSLSLLSGGEQAMTAVALLFAVFMTNPAPICVLDEVDAPLDDANVDRFCRLLSDISRRADTRFLIITHHRLTMAKMDRLFGVTMAERGVSSLVSVDLRQAELYAESRQEDLFD